MTKKPFPALCADCAHSKPEKESAWNLRCHNPKVNAKDHWALGSISSSNGSSCIAERERKWPSECGMRGNLWAEKALAGKPERKAQDDGGYDLVAAWDRSGLLYPDDTVDPVFQAGWDAARSTT